MSTLRLSVRHIVIIMGMAIIYNLGIIKIEKPVLNGIGLPSHDAYCPYKDLHGKDPKGKDPR